MASIAHFQNIVWGKVVTLFVINRISAMEQVEETKIGNLIVG
jgi:hypothetical protein